MEDLLAARTQMAISLGFHIIFSCIGMTMPFLMAFAEWRWLRSKQEVYLDLAKSWSKGVAIFFAVGAVSGTVLSFELGLLWPGFMDYAGEIIGMPFSWEGTAFFLEAIALGFFLYGWNKVNRWVHWASGIVVGLSGVLSGIFVVAANAWMNSPAGFDWVDGQAVNIDPYEAMFNDAWFSQALHMTIAAFVSTSFAVAGLHALLLLKNPGHVLHQKAYKIALTFGAISAILQPLSGDISAKDIAVRQPEKLAAMEAHFETEKGADLIIGGIPDVEKGSVDYAIRLPNMLSFLAHGEFDATVTGLEEFPREHWPPVLITHIAFQVMIMSGMLMAAVGLVFLIFYWKKKELLHQRWWLWVVGICTPLGFIAVEAGWVVTEVGRQPWIVYKMFKTADSVSPMPGLQYTCYILGAIYLLLAFVLILLMKRQIRVVNQKYIHHG
jgi:cytochrome bd ubiquinol oxidase subunit I